jgi:hypothetical protein
MANELNLNLVFSVSNSGLAMSQQVGAQYNQSTAATSASVATVGTTESTISLAGITTPGFLYLKNMDSTSYVDVGRASGSYFVRVKPGEVALFRLQPAVITLYVIASGASVLLYHWLLAD